MRLALIPPTKYLTDLAAFNQNNYHLALAQRVLSEPEYSEFYREQSQKGAFVILDNGACELGTSISKDLLIEAIDLINPSQVVLPDKLDDAKETLKLSYEFLDFFKSSDKKLSFMAVVQGRTKDEWLNCFRELSSNNQINTIGIPNTNAVYPSSKHYFSRVKTIEFLAENDFINPTQNIHLLGLNSSGHIELKKLNHLKFIEGVDSSAPIVHGALGVQFREGIRYEKIRRYLEPEEILSEEQLKLIKQNIALLMKIVSNAS